MSSVEGIAPEKSSVTDTQRIDGAVAAALLGTASGCLAVAIITIAADASKHVAKILTFYTPTGPLSGVSSLSLFVWLLTWWTLATLWRKKTLAGGIIVVTALTQLGVAIVLTFPPVLDSLLGR